MKTMTDRLRTIVAALGMAAIVACGGGGAPLTVNVDGNERTLDITSSGTYTSTKTFTQTRDGGSTITKAASHYIVVGNYEIDTSSGMLSMNKPLTEAGQMRFAIQIVGREDTDDKSPIVPGTYTTAADKYDKLDYANLTVFDGGKETRTSINISKAEGEVKITSVTDETVSGEIDLKEGDKTIKGGFTAKIIKRKS